MVVLLKNGPIPAHHFVLAARNDSWSRMPEGKPPELGMKNISSWWAFPHITVPYFAPVDWSHLDQSVGECILRWCYSDDLSSGNNNQEADFLLRLMREAGKLGLAGLVARCERGLVAEAGRDNCVRLYTAADEVNAEGLRDHCSGLISAHWVR